MRTIGFSQALQGIIVAVMMLQAACGGSSSTSNGGVHGGNPESGLSVSLINPPSTVYCGTSVVLTAQVLGPITTSVAWTVDDIPNGNAGVGQITGGGTTVTYTAPSNAGIHVLAATSVLDSSKSDSVQVAVLPPSAISSVTVSPTTCSLNPGAQQPFAALVTGTGTYSSAITWAVDGIANGNATVGNITIGSGNTAIYTAPASAGPHTIKATSLTDASMSATASITVQNLSDVNVLVAPVGLININSSGTLWFKATVTGSANTEVSWSVDGVPNGNASVGTITGSGNAIRYNAPSTAGTHTITATSAADPLIRGSSTLAVRVGTCIPSPASSLIANVKNAPYNAKGDGVADDTAAIQRAMNAVAGTGGTVEIPAGTYLVNPVANSNAGVRPGSNTRVLFESGAVLQAMPTSTSSYIILCVSGVQNVFIQGGTIKGNRFNNTITDTEENGMGIQISNSQHVVVENLTVQDCWCDGVYVSDESGDVTLNGVVSGNNRRCGLAIVSVSGMVARGCTFKGTTGMMENGVWANGMGVDVEPNRGETVRDIQFLGNTITQNAMGGLGIGPSNSNMATTFVINCVVDGNTVSSNGDAEKGMFGIVASSTGGHLILNNTVANNFGIGLYLYGDAADILIQGNTVTGTIASAYSYGYGILLYQTSSITVQGNTVLNNAYYGIRDAYPTGTNTIAGNTSTGNHPNY